GGDDSLDVGAQLAVVDGGPEVIAASGLGQVGDDVEVHLDRLRALALLRQDPTDPRGPQAAQLDPVGHVLRVGPGVQLEGDADQLAAGRTDTPVHSTLA